MFLETLAVNCKFNKVAMHFKMNERNHLNIFQTGFSNSLSKIHVMEGYVYVYENTFSEMLFRKAALKMFGKHRRWSSMFFHFRSICKGSEKQVISIKKSVLKILGKPL